MDPGVRRRLLAAVAGLVLVAGGVVASLALVSRMGGGSAGSPPGKPTGANPTASFPILPGPRNVIDQTPGGQRFPGGLVKLDAGDGGGWLVVYQRFVDGAAQVFAREGPDLLEPFGPETLVSSPSLGPAYDPGVVELEDGTVIVTWSNKGVVWYAKRLGPGRYGPVAQLFSDPGGTVFEQTLATIDGRPAVFYDYHPLDRKEFLWDPRTRTIGPGPSPGPPATIATEGPGYGTEGVQKRATAASTGRPGQEIAVWSQHAAVPCAIPSENPGAVQNCGPRPIFGAISEDSGRTWGPPFEIVSFSDHDLVNPFAILVAPDDLRIYFTVDRHIPEAAYVESTDHGRTWSGLRDVWLPRDLVPARMVLQVDDRHRLIALLAARGFGELVTFLIDRLPA